MSEILCKLYFNAAKVTAFYSELRRPHTFSALGRIYAAVRGPGLPRKIVRAAIR
jgi:hypothetical protein